MHDAFASLEQKSDDIVVNAKKFDGDVTKKIDDNYDPLDAKIDQFQIINTAELCNHAKNIDSQHETHMDKTKLATDDLRDDMRVVQACRSKVLQDVQCELSTPDKVGSMSHVSQNNSKWKLSQVKSLNTKALDCHLDNLKMSGDSAQDTILLHSNVNLLIHVRTDASVEIPNFDDIDEYFNHKMFLVPPNISYANVTMNVLL